jgi:hypothetical protein
VYLTMRARLCRVRRRFKPRLRLGDEETGWRLGTNVVFRAVTHSARDVTTCG